MVSAGEREEGEEAEFFSLRAVEGREIRRFWCPTSWLLLVLREDYIYIYDIYIDGCKKGQD